LTYCALDSVYEYRIFKLQQKELEIQKQKGGKFGKNVDNAYKLFHEGILALAEAERQGLRIDMNYCLAKKRQLEHKIKKLETKIFDSKFYRHWAHSVSKKPNLNSGTQLASFLYGTKKIKPLKLTETGQGSTDEEALKLLNIPELNWMIERTKLIKLKDTYLEAFIRESVDSYIHPFFNLHLVKTYRSSSSDPNFQNIPKRDEASMKTIRQAIYPRPGHQFLEMDFKGIEVAIAACYHKDENMLKYITDKSSDMHGDMAKQIFMIKNWDKKNHYHAYLRSATKNSFVFPQFYGDYYKNCAINFCNNWLNLPSGQWKKTDGVNIQDNETIAANMIKNGVTSLSDFESHIQKIEKHFWTKRFPQYAKWKDFHYSLYQKYGYVSMYTGFACSGLMSRNDSINYPIQGAAFHCLLWTLVEVNKRFKKLNMKSKIVGQIHDAIVFDIYPPELKKVYKIVHKIATVDLPKEFSWIIVPLEIEAEICDIDKSWAEKKEWNPGII